LIFRFANEFYEPLWNRKYIDFVEITSAEDIGVNKRGGYYDSSGAVRDMVQNHLLQLLAMVAMEPPAKFDAKSVRDETTKVLQTLRPITENFEDTVVMGQYTDGRAGNQPLNSYLNEEGVPNDSRTETYSALKVFVDNFRWSDVPFYIRTGKRLPTRVTEVVLHFRKSPWMNKIAHSEGDESAHNKLVIRIQPDEGIKMNFAMKKPGLGFNSQPVSMDFHYSDLKETRISLAYERLLLDAILGDATLYARGDTVEECWKFIDPILDYWKSGKGKIHTYEAGSWGPEAANELMTQTGHIWRNPCKNFKGEGSHCEL
jgi:glucose-6-phosphate 1-dehydrogenase